MPKSSAKPEEKLSFPHHTVLQISFNEKLSLLSEKNLTNSPVKDWVPHQLVLAQVLLKECKDKDGCRRPGDVVESQVDAVEERLDGEVVVETVEENSREACNVLVEKVMDEQSNPVVVPVAMN